MMDFKIGNLNWDLIFVEHDDEKLRRSDGTYSVGVTDLDKREVILSDMLSGMFLRKVLCHEIVHCAMFSYGIDLSVEQEELVADLIATYGDEIIDKTNIIFRRLRNVA